jgi:hypothetical protein
VSGRTEGETEEGQKTEKKNLDYCCWNKYLLVSFSISYLVMCRWMNLKGGLILLSFL